MKCLNNRAETHLTGQVECEMEGMDNGGWVNQGFCSSAPRLPRAVSTIYNPQPQFQGSLDSLHKLDPLGAFPERESSPASTEQSLVKKQRGCCSFIKGRNPFRPVSSVICTVSLICNFILYCICLQMHSK